MSRGLAWAAARVALYFAASVGFIVTGMYIDARLSRLWGWSESIREGLPHFLWTIGACLGVGACALRLLGGRSPELLCAWLIGQIWITLYVGFNSLFSDLWLVLSIPLSLWLPGVALGTGLRAAAGRYARARATPRQ